MGRDKALLPWKNTTFVEQLLSVTNPIFKHVTILSNNLTAYSSFGVNVIEDQIKGVGPLGGIFTGLSHSKNDFCFFLTCDTPLLSSVFFAHFLTQADPHAINYATIQGALHPLPVLIPRILLKEVEQSIHKNEFKLRRFYSMVRENKIDMNSFEGEMLNINTPDDYNSLTSHL